MTAESISTEKRGDTLWITLTSEKIVDEALSTQVGGKLVELVKSEDSSKLVLDCRGAMFMSPAFIGQLVLFKKAVVASSKKIVLCGIQDGPMEVFRIMRLHKIFTIARSTDQAIVDRCFRQKKLTTERQLYSLTTTAR